MALVIRPAASGDVETIQKVSDRAFSTVRHIYQPSAVAVANVLHLASRLECLIAEHDGAPAGVVRFVQQDGVLRVIGLAVLPEYRRRGIACNLIDYLSEIASSRRCRALALHTVVQTGNVAVFERLGFELLNEQPDAYSVGPSSEPLTEAYMERACAAKPVG